MMPPKRQPKGPVVIRNDRKWESLKEDIHRTYITESKTLPATMNEIEKIHGFKQSERKWKGKLKEWNYLKKLSEEDMKIVVAKIDKRSREGKKTVVSHAGSTITEQRIRNFKRRKTVKASTAISPSAATPCNVTYGTPRFEDNTTIPITSNAEDHRSEEGKDLQLSTRKMEVLENHTATIYSDQELWSTHSSSPESSTSPTVAGPSSEMTRLLSPVVSTENIRPTATNATVTLDSSPQDIGIREANYTINDTLSRKSKKVHFIDEPLYVPTFDIYDSLLPDATHDVLNKVAFYERKDEFDTAISICSEAINRYKEIKALYGLQYKLASLFEVQNRLDDSANMYCRSLSGCEAELGMTASVTIKVRHCLINALKKKAKYQEALILCQDELNSFNAFGDEIAKLECLRTLVLLHQKLEQSNDALRPLILGLAQLLRYDSGTVRLQGLLEMITELLQAAPDVLLQLERHRPENVKELLLLLGQMLEMARGHPDWDFGDFPPMMFKAMRLAWLLSYLEDESQAPLDQQMTESLFRVGLSRLERPENKTTEKKATVYAWYAAYLNRQKSLVKCAAYLLASWELFMKCKKHPRVVQALSMIMQRLRKIIPIINKMEGNELSAHTKAFLESAKLALRQGFVSEPDVCHSHIDVECHEELELLDPELSDIDVTTLSTKEDDKGSIFTYTTGTSSSKFGVTLSESEYQGYNIGELMFRHIVQTAASKE